MKKKSQSFMDVLQSTFASGTILIAYGIALAVYFFFFGNPVNFQGNDPANKPLDGNFLGMIYKGGPFVVPILIACIIIIITFSIERIVMLNKARGKSKLSIFVKTIQTLLSENKIEEASEACDKQRGSLANIVKACLSKYRYIQQDVNMDKEQKVLSMQKEWEEASALELPMLSKNLVIFSTLASICVLFGLLGTVIGMIRAFAALAQAGAPDALALATGISEALINTAFGILGSTLAIILYNAFSTRIDSFTYKMDEAGFSLIQTFASQTKR